MGQEEVLRKTSTALISGDKSETIKYTKQSVELKIDPLKTIKILRKALRNLGEKFEKMEVFLADLMLAAEAMKEAVNILAPILKAQAKSAPTEAIIVIGTVKGDIHDIGKNLVITSLQAEGYEVHDLGVDVPSIEFITKAEEVNADIIGASSLLQTSLPYLKDIVDILEDGNLRGKYKFIIGGAVVSKEFADSINADGFALDAPEAVKLVKRIVKEKG